MIARNARLGASSRAVPPATRPLTYRPAQARGPCFQQSRRALPATPCPLAARGLPRVAVAVSSPIAAPESAPRSLALYTAKLAAQAERYADMVAAMRGLAVLAGEQELSREERNLLSAAFKNHVGARRSSWRTLEAIEEAERAKGNGEHVARIRAYRGEVAAEIEACCGEALALLDAHLLPSASSPEAAAFFAKMRADHLRYRAEPLEGGARAAAVAAALAAYKAALGQALNYSVFCYEMLEQPSLACVVAAEGFKAAIGELDSLGEGAYTDSAVIMQLLRDNLVLWAEGARRPQD
ncbi:hypothetical protein HYH03_015131 [Edaphochlamys debaryana]|uniref:14-3-3 domain-containing protein n=1 Tax=Edaphochlamys debaryana TaxID=47281 RepID=A0A835XK05_9CHLO|nr:hypothetical protein HYH03_015131 [Edaphochlamys debaryana]|eukprot:KAG2486167.1 hypothetical protein HYH03_015131 [Edaphochlamys debaryana]